MADDKKPKRYRITFHSMNGDTSDVLIGHNFVLNQYKRNVETEIDENFLNVLKDSVVTTTVQDATGANFEVTIPQHAYTVHGLV